eukprot:scpid106460/ scgid5310/ 
MLGDQEVCNFFSVAATTVFDCCGLILVSSATQNYILNSVSTAMKFDTDFSYVAPVLLYVACSKHARTPRHMYSVRSLFTRSPVRVKRASHGKRYEKIRVKLDPVPRRGFQCLFFLVYKCLKRGSETTTYGISPIRTTIMVHVLWMHTVTVCAYGVHAHCHSLCIWC